MNDQTTKTWVDNIFVFAGILILLAVTQLYVHVFLEHSYDVFLTEDEIEEVKWERFSIFAKYL